MNDFIQARVPEVTHIPAGSPDWVRDEIWDPGWAACFAAALVVSSPWMTRRWRRLGWLLLLFVAPMQFLDWDARFLPA